MKRIEIEPTFEVPVMIGDTTTKVKVKKLSPKTVKKISKKYELKKSDKEKALEDLREDLLFAVKELEANDVSASRVRELAKEVREIKREIERLESETEKESEKLHEAESKEFVLAAAGDDKKTVDFFTELAKEYSWGDVRNIVIEAYKQREKDFLGG